MNKTNRMLVVLLSAGLVVTMSNSQTAFGQRIRIGGGSNQNDNDKQDKKEKKDQNSNSGNNNGNSNNNQNNSNGNSNKSGNPQLQPFIPGGKNQNDPNKKNKKDGQGQNNPGQSGSKKVFVPGQQGFPNKGSNQPVVIGTNGSGLAQPANKKIGYWKGDHWQGSRKIDNWSQVFGNNKKPFSSEWYNDHPRAWRYNSNKSNVWVVATVPGVYSWLGWGNVPQQYQVGYNNGPRFDPSLYGDWYPLGVYSLMAGPDDVGTRVLQLAVDRRGRINGNYFDMITDSDHSVSGVIQRQTQRAEWSLNQNQNVRFRASIVRLLQPYGSLTVQLPGGEQRWQFVRLENE